MLIAIMYPFLWPRSIGWPFMECIAGQFISWLFVSLCFTRFFVLPLRFFVSLLRFFFSFHLISFHLVLALVFLAYSLILSVSKSFVSFHLVCQPQAKPSAHQHDLQQPGFTHNRAINSIGLLLSSLSSNYATHNDKQLVTTIINYCLPRRAVLVDPRPMVGVLADPSPSSAIILRRFSAQIRCCSSFAQVCK